ncbi:MFS transporter [Agrobacterium vitis]|uniref:MFS transporter n=1 Tax=Agrobacterium vitis TaxID=373 RepID=A0A6L6VNX6_AGRVI|nr:MFS transporter [Agrobacterium vitis]MUZ75837.1 MFS transporter [Agrobacterium vitis]MVA22749.1 MFS transporter [Agrobacterium vitis]
MNVQRDYVNIGLLAVCQALYMSTTVLTVATAGLAAETLLTRSTYATLPQAIVPVVAMLSTLPASYVMRQIGRKNGFLLGVSFGVVSGSVCAYAIYISSFTLFLVGTSLLGVYQAFAAFYRFAVADQADEAIQGKAVSLVLAGGVFAAVIGPGLASYTSGLLAPFSFLGCFLASIAINLLALLALSFVQLKKAPLVPRAGPKAITFDAVLSPRFLVGAVFCGVGTGTMMLVMTTTPLAMIGCGFDLDVSSTVISWHVLAMFVPSFFTGHLVKHFGLYRILTAGLVLMGASAIFAMNGISEAHFATSLVVNGLAWNLMYVGGSTLLARAGNDGNRSILQGINETLTFGLTAVGAFASGILFSEIGWNAVNLVALCAVPVLFMFMHSVRERTFLAI